MWTTTAFVAALTLLPAQQGGLTLTNVRSTYGVEGAPRPATGLLPGDRMIVCFDIDGITIDDTGRARYSVAMEMTDTAGKVHYKQDAQPLEAFAALGGSRLPAFAEMDVGLEQPPGEYTVKVTVTDRATNRTATLTRTGKVLAPAFGIVRLATTTDPEGQHGTTSFGPGETLWVNFGAVGFARDQATGQPNVAFELRILDENSRPTVKPFTGEVTKDVPEQARSLPGLFQLALNRPGSFTVELSATDRVARKTAKLSFPLVVQSPK